MSAHHKLYLEFMRTDNEAYQTIPKAAAELYQARYKTIAITLCQGIARDSDREHWRFAGLIVMLDPPLVDTRTRN
jgi:hypothetical protein